MPTEIETSAPAKRIKPHWFQKETIYAVREGKRFIVMLGGTGGGKALSLDTLIPTVKGFVPMGEIKEGMRVFDGNGAPSRVKYVSPIYHDRKCYLLTFDDGNTIVADAEHLWVTQTRKQRKNESRWQHAPDAEWIAARPQCQHGDSASIITTDQIAQTVKHNGATNHSISTQCFYGHGHRVQVPPYTLGAWLGDGTCREASFTCADDEIIQAIRDEGIDVSEMKGQPGNAAGSYWFRGLMPLLRERELLNNKHIPREYMLNDTAVRLSVLQGLMDTDGHCAMDGRCEISLSNKRLADDAYALICGLGIKATMKRRKTTHKDSYRISFTTTMEVFRLSRKKERLPKHTRPSVRRRFIVSCEETEPVPVRCISVNSPENTYLCTESFIRTHNTWWAPVWLAYLINRDAAAGNGKGARYLAIGCTSDMVNDMVLPEIVGHFTDTNLEGHYHISGRRYELPTGGNIYLRSAEKPYRIEGQHVRGAILDEPSEMKALIWPIIMSRTAFYQAPVLFCGYPTNMGWYYEALYQAWEKGDPDIVVIEFPSTANPLYPKEEMERAKRTLPAWLYEMRWEGKFRKPFGLVYPDFGDNCYVDPFEIPSDWPTYTGVDPAAQYGALMVAWDRGTFYCYNEYYEEQVKSAEEYAEEMLEPQEGMNQGWIYDSARLLDVVNLAAHGCGPFYKANKAVRPGIITLTGLIKTGKWKVMRGRCPVYCDMMAKYRWPTDPATGKVVEGAENPIKKNDHLPDCARYLAHTLASAPLEERDTLVVDLGEEISPY